MNNLFQRLCSVRSFLLVEKASLVNCNGQFSFSHRTSQVEPSQLLLDGFFKSSTLPWRNRNKPLPRVFLEASFLLQQTFKTVVRPIFIWRGTSRDFSSPLAGLRPKKLALLAYELVKLDSGVVSMGFSGAMPSFSHFS